ncbi:hypothetical protein CBR_g2941 [Chara braunii]|uniref:Uncharacterized protein n=1 Tax=Chara braunii TaxID=69332 RepID=A0A388KEG7_CHABU|nr:hypothetical protein CBR_g2941 [Chara braunii]|eukprot:GBG68397.1 hypothetical protein CBR_g2941 [Chara braunii]
MGDELAEAGRTGLSSTLHDRLGGDDGAQVEREAGVEVDDGPQVEREARVEVVQVDDGAQVEREAGVGVDDRAQVEREVGVEVDDRAQVEREAGVEVDGGAQVEREAGVEVVQVDDGAQVEREAGVEVDDRAQVEREAEVEVDGCAQVEREAGVEVDDGVQVEREVGVEVDDRAQVEREAGVEVDDRAQVEREVGVEVDDRAQVEREDDVVTTQEDVVRADGTALVEGEDNVVEGDVAHDGGEGSDTLDPTVERFIADEMGPALSGLTPGTMRALGASPSGESGAVGDEMRDFAQMSFGDPPTPRQSRRADIEDIARALAAAGYSAEEIEQAFAGASRIRTRDTLQQGYEEAREHPQEEHEDAAAAKIPGGSGPLVHFTGMQLTTTTCPIRPCVHGSSSEEVAPDEVPPVVVVDLGSEPSLQTSVSGRRAPEDTACPFDAAELARAAVHNVTRKEDTYSRRPGMPPPPPRSRHGDSPSTPACAHLCSPSTPGRPRVRRGDEQFIVEEDDPETELARDEDPPEDDEYREDDESQEEERDDEEEEEDDDDDEPSPRPRRGSGRRQEEFHETRPRTRSRGPSAATGASRRGVSRTGGSGRERRRGSVAISLDTVRKTGRFGSILPQSSKDNYVFADEEAMNIVGVIENVVVKVGRVHVLVNALVIDVTWTQTSEHPAWIKNVELLIIQAWRTNVEGDLLGFLFGSVRPGRRQLIAQELITPIVQLADDLSPDIFSQSDDSPAPYVLKRSLDPYLQWTACLEEPRDEDTLPSRQEYLKRYDIIPHAFYPKEEEVVINDDEEDNDEETSEEGSYSEYSEGELSEVEEEEEETGFEWEALPEEAARTGTEAEDPEAARKREEIATGKCQLELASGVNLRIGDDPTKNPEPQKPEDGDPAAASPSTSRRRQSRSPSSSSPTRPPSTWLSVDDPEAHLPLLLLGSLIGTVLVCVFTARTLSWLGARRWSQFGKPKEEEEAKAGRKLKLRLSPGPAPWPIMGNLFQLQRYPHRGLAKMAEKYGGVMTVQLGSVRTLVVSSPAAVKEILVDQGATFASRPLTATIDALTSGGRDFVFAPYGPLWRKHRKMASVHMFSPKRMAQVDGIQRKFFACLEEELLRKGGGSGGADKQERGDMGGKEQGNDSPGRTEERTNTSSSSSFSFSFSNHVSEAKVGGAGDKMEAITDGRRDTDGLGRCQPDDGNGRDRSVGTTTMEELEPVEFREKMFCFILDTLTYVIFGSPVTPGMRRRVARSQLAVDCSPKTTTMTTGSQQDGDGDGVSSRSGLWTNIHGKRFRTLILELVEKRRESRQKFIVGDSAVLDRGQPTALTAVGLNFENPDAMVDVVFDNLLSDETAAAGAAATAAAAAVAAKNLAASSSFKNGQEVLDRGQPTALTAVGLNFENPDAMVDVVFDNLLSDETAAAGAAATAAAAAVAAKNLAASSSFKNGQEVLDRGQPTALTAVGLNFENPDAMVDVVFDNLLSDETAAAGAAATAAAAAVAAKNLAASSSFKNGQEVLDRGQPTALTAVGLNFENPDAMVDVVFDNLLSDETAAAGAAATAAAAAVAAKNLAASSSFKNGQEVLDRGQPTALTAVGLNFENPDAMVDVVFDNLLSDETAAAGAAATAAAAAVAAKNLAASSSFKNGQEVLDRGQPTALTAVGLNFENPDAMVDVVFDNLLSDETAAAGAAATAAAAAVAAKNLAASSSFKNGQEVLDRGQPTALTAVGLNFENPDAMVDVVFDNLLSDETAAAGAAATAAAAAVAAKNLAASSSFKNGQEVLDRGQPTALTAVGLNFENPDAMVDVVFDNLLSDETAAAGAAATAAAAAVAAKNLAASSSFKNGQEVLDRGQPTALTAVGLNFENPDAMVDVVFDNLLSDETAAAGAAATAAAAAVAAKNLAASSSFKNGQEVLDRGQPTALTAVGLNFENPDAMVDVVFDNLLSDETAAAGAAATAAAAAVAAKNLAASSSFKNGQEVLDRGQPTALTAVGLNFENPDAMVDVVFDNLLSDETAAAGAAATAAAAAVAAKNLAASSSFKNGQEVLDRGQPTALTAVGLNFENPDAMVDVVFDNLLSDETAAAGAAATAAAAAVAAKNLAASSSFKNGQEVLDRGQPTALTAVGLNFENPDAMVDVVFDNLLSDETAAAGAAATAAAAAVAAKNLAASSSFKNGQEVLDRGQPTALTAVGLNFENPDAMVDVVFDNLLSDETAAAGAAATAAAAAVAAKNLAASSSFKNGQEVLDRGQPTALTAVGLNFENPDAMVDVVFDNLLSDETAAAGAAATAAAAAVAAKNLAASSSFKNGQEVLDRGQPTALTAVGLNFENPDAMVDVVFDNLLSDETAAAGAAATAAAAAVAAKNLAASSSFKNGQEVLDRGQPTALTAVGLNFENPDAMVDVVFDNLLSDETAAAGAAATAAAAAVAAKNLAASSSFKNGQEVLDRGQPTALTAVGLNFENPDAMVDVVFDNLLSDETAAAGAAATAAAAAVAAKNLAASSSFKNGQEVLDRGQPTALTAVGLNFENPDAMVDVVFDNLLSDETAAAGAAATAAAAAVAAKNLAASSSFKNGQEVLDRGQPTALTAVGLNFENPDAMVDVVFDNLLSDETAAAGAAATAAAAAVAAKNLAASSSFKNGQEVLDRGQPTALTAVGLNFENPDAMVDVVFDNLLSDETAAAGAAATAAAAAVAAKNLAASSSFKNGQEVLDRGQPTALTAVGLNFENPDAMVDVVFDNLLSDETAAAGAAATAAAAAVAAKNLAASSSFKNGQEVVYCETEACLLLTSLLSAGTDTTTSVTVFLLMELLRHPKMMAKLKAEVDEAVEVAGDSQKFLSENDLENLPYLNAVLYETLCLHTPGPLFTHQAVEDAVVFGYDVPAGTQVLVNAWAIMHDPEVWPEPWEFRPETVHPRWAAGRRPAS